MNNDLISRSALLKTIGTETYYSIDPYNQRGKIFEKVALAPAVDARVVRHGRWDKVQVWKDNPHTTLKCSACKTWQPIYEHDNWDYCPFCGAKMDGDEHAAD